MSDTKWAGGTMDLPEDLAKWCDLEEIYLARVDRQWMAAHYVAGKRYEGMHESPVEAVRKALGNAAEYWTDQETRATDAFGNQDYSTYWQNVYYMADKYGPDAWELNVAFNADFPKETEDD